MKLKNLAVIASILSLPAAANALDISGQFVNLNFDAGTVNTGGNFNGFDNPNCEIIGWKNWNNAPTLADSGVEGPTAWWGAYQNNSAFMKMGDGGYNLSAYTIQAGDVFDVGLMGKGWGAGWATPGAQLTITLFYGSDPSQNSLGSFNTGALTQGDSSAYAHFGSTIAAMPASVGQILGVSVLSSGAANTYANFDSLTVAVVPEPATFSLVAVAGLGIAMMRRKNR